MTGAGLCRAATSAQLGPSCAACAVELLHCHGTLVLHADGSVECDVEDCGVAEEAHELVLMCTEVDPRCCAG